MMPERNDRIYAELTAQGMDPTLYQTAHGLTVIQSPERVEIYLESLKQEMLDSIGRRKGARVDVRYTPGEDTAELEVIFLEAVQ